MLSVGVFNFRMFLKYYRTDVDEIDVIEIYPVFVNRNFLRTDGGENATLKSVQKNCRLPNTHLSALNCKFHKTVLENENVYKYSYFPEDYFAKDSGKKMKIRLLQTIKSCAGKLKYFQQ
jgi:hypothetical protein